MISLNDYIEKYSKQHFIVSLIIFLVGLSLILIFPNASADASTKTPTLFGWVALVLSVIGAFSCVIIFLINAGDDF